MPLSRVSASVRRPRRIVPHVRAPWFKVSVDERARRARPEEEFEAGLDLEMVAAALRDLDVQRAHVGNVEFEAHLRASRVHPRDAGARVFYDPNLRPRLWPRDRAAAIARATMALSDWILPSREDAEWMFGTGEAAAVIDACRRAGARGIVYKRGADGCVVDDGRSRVVIGAHPVTAVDATGAGDCFDGAFAARLAAGDEPVEAARYANAAAALATTGYGAVDPLPRPADVDRLLRAVPRTGVPNAAGGPRGAR